ncbi:MAG TPA: PAS domain S-box protein [Gemmatimonadales bacterium]|nr:PAS domain S-box protein [Gemmatimonadales bacterium]
MPSSLRALILDDDDAQRQLLAESLRVAGEFVVDAPSTAEAYGAYPASARFDVVLLALQFLGCQWQELLPAVRERWPGSAVVVLADGADDEAVAAAVQAGADNYVLRDSSETTRVSLALRAALAWAGERARSERVQGQLRRLLEDIQVGVFRSSLDGGTLEANAATLRILGYTSLADMQATPIQERYRHQEVRRALIARLRREGSVRGYEADMTRADGTPIRVSISVRLDGRELMDGLLEDITERHRAQEALERSEAELRALVTALPDLVMMFDRDGRYLQIAPNHPDLLVRPAAEMLGRSIREVVPGDRAEMALRLITEALDTRATVSHDYSLELPTGLRWFHASFTPVGTDNVIVVARDITTERESRRQRETSEERFRALIENSRDAVTLMDAAGLILFQSPSATRITGYSPDDVLGLDGFSLVHPEDVTRARDTFQDALAHPGRAVTTTHRVRHKLGDWRHYEFDAVNWLDHPAIGAVVLNYRDVTDRLRSERAARESSERLDLALEAAGGAAWDWDLLLEEVTFSPRWALLLGFEPGEIGTDLAEWERRLHPDDGAAVERARIAHVEGRQPVYEVEHRLRAKDGSWKWVLDRGRVVGWDADGRPRRMVGILTDLSERKRLEAQVAQSQRLEAVGQLAGGIAHDFNNVLTAILSTSELILLELGPSDPHREDLEEIKRSANRAAALTRQLLAYSRRQVLQPKVTDLNGVVANVDRMLRRLLGEQVTLAQSLEPALGRVRADRGQVEQILVNLAVNACDAMPDGGRLTIATANVDGIPGDAGPVVEGPYVTLSVSDTGVGMDEATRSRVFEPFFTTKSRGQGTGLGLATVYGIVRQSGGVIRVTSEPGAGSTFRIYLPRVDDEVEADTAELPLPKQVAVRGGAGTILLVEDEEAVRRLGKRILEQEGYAVLAAEHAADALAIASAHRGPIHLLVTDVVMPGRSGVELARDLQQLRPGIPVLFTSGYPETTRGRWQPTDGWGAFLQKPFTPSELVEAVRAATTVLRAS